MTAVLKATLGGQGLPGEENALGHSPGECVRRKVFRATLSIILLGSPSSRPTSPSLSPKCVRPSWSEILRKLGVPQTLTLGLIPINL